MSTLSEKSRNNLKIIKHLENESILSSSSSRDITIQEEFIEVAGYKLISKSFENTDSNSLRELADQLRNNETNTQ